jgi:hypothetical protein
VVVDAARMPSLGPAALFIVKLHSLCSIFTQLKHKIRQDPGGTDLFDSSS